MDPEQAYRQEYGGYTIEMMAHTVGYRPNYDALASHARTRYHLVAKNPSVNAAPPDPMLWIVHYHQTDPNRVIPAAQVPPTPQAQQVLNERRWLESQGRLDKKDFMLHDQEHWPTINVPSGAHMQRQMQQAGFYGAQPMPNSTPRQQQYPPPGAYPQQPPPKRQRQQGPAAIQGPVEALPDTSVEDEENTQLGDFFDHLTPREISMTRYMQHHRWMEEVFSSPYDSHSIMPADLGLGLLGELKGLTAGIVEAPSLEFMQPPSARAQEARPFTNLNKEQLDEFNKRVEVHLQEGRAEIERMKAEHASKMQEWKKTKAVIQAEKRLRNATWEGHESAVSTYRFEAPRDQDFSSKETVEDVVKATEDLLGIKIRAHEEASLVSRGGLEEEQEIPVVKSARDVDHPNGQSGTDLNTAAVPSNSTGMKGMSQPVANTLQTSPYTMPQQTSMTGGKGHSAPANMDEDAAMDDMDLDIQQPDIDFGAEHAPTPTTTAATTTPIATGLGNAAGTSNPTQTSTQAPTQTASLPTTTPITLPPDSDGNAANQDMFNDTEFADLADLDDDGDDGGLIDFEGGMGLEDSAFGDALHGMDGQEGGETPHDPPV